MNAVYTTGSDATAIRPFHVNVPEARACRPAQAHQRDPLARKETVADASQGVQLATMRSSRATGGRNMTGARARRRLNALPNFITEIDGLDIHFIHVRSKHENALPLIVTHGWPGSVVEQLKIVDPLTNPTAHGGSASDAFHVVIPSMPGYGFSGKPTTTGWDTPRIARAWTVLMKRLGYTRFVAQGGDWGALVTEQMGVLAPPELLGIHINLPSAVPAEISTALQSGSPPPGLAARESVRSSGSPSSLRTACPTPSRWRTIRRRCTGSRIHRSGWPPGSSTTNCGATSSSPAPSTGNTKASRATTFSTTSHSTG